MSTSKADEYNKLTIPQLKALCDAKGVVPQVKVRLNCFLSRYRLAFQPLTHSVPTHAAPQKSRLG
jgi:hypothetical protein